jgi:hypothetical protein
MLASNMQRRNCAAMRPCQLRAAAATATVLFVAGSSLCLLLDVVAWARRRRRLRLRPTAADGAPSTPPAGAVNDSEPGRESPAMLPVCHGYLDLIGNTRLVRINSLSTATGCEVYAKTEFQNPGGTSKDRIAAHIVRDAERQGKLSRGGTIVEGTSGSTGISLAFVARGTSAVAVTQLRAVQDTCLNCSCVGRAVQHAATGV